MSESNENEDKSQYQETDDNDSRSFDPAYEKIDTILSENDGKYLVLWCRHEFKDLTWETEVDRKQLNLFQKREQFDFPNKSDDVFAMPANKLTVDNSHESLASCELVTLKKLINCYNYRKDFLIKENMGIDTSNACITFLSILQTEGNEHGPYLIVSDKKWYSKLRERSEMLSIYYGGSGESCEKINELYFQDDNESPHFHTLVISPQKFEEYIQYISKIHYRVAIFHSSKAQLIYKKYQSLKVGMSICINVINPTQSSKQISILSSAIITKKCSKQLNSNETKRIKEINGKIQYSLKKLKQGDSQFVSPPIISIDCPLSEIQKKLCQSVLTEYSQMPRTSVEKVLRICTHPFLCMNGEYDLGSPDLIESSTKLQILNEILTQCARHSMKTLIISQYQQMLEYIMDILDQDNTIYDDLSAYLKKDTTPSDITTVYLYNPKYNTKLPDYFSLGNIQCVVIFDGGTAIWNEMIQKHRGSRKPFFDVSKVYHLECRGCCERELLALSELSTFIKSKADAILHTVAIYAFSDFMIPSIDKLLLNGIPDEKVESFSLTGKFIQQCDFTPTLNGEIIHGQPPVLNPERMIIDESKSNHDKDNNSSDEENESSEYSYKWTIHERNLLTRGLFQMGLNRLESLQKVVGLYLPIDEIEKMIPPILEYLLKAFGSSSGYITTRNYIKKIGEKYPIKKLTEIPTFNDRLYLKNIESKAYDLIKRLDSLDYLHNSLGGDGNQTDIKPEQVPFFRFGYNLKEWWTENYDRALAYITWRFGFGCFDHFEEYAESNEYCKLFIHLPEFIEYELLTKRELDICNAAKRIPVTDQKVIDTLSKRATKWPEDVQATIIKYILRYGILEDKSGKPNYDLFADEINCPDLDGDELKNYVDELIKLCETSLKAENPEIPTNHAKRILDRVDAMKDLRKLLRDPKDFLEKIKITHWRQLPKKWTPEIERHYFEKVESHGFGDLQSIFKDQVFRNVLESIQSFLVTEDEVVRRINVICGKIEKSQSKKSANSPSSTFSPSTNRKPSSSGSSSRKKQSKPASQSNVKKINVVRLKELKKGVKFPLQVTQFGYILDLGHIITDRDGFHNERYIFPAGYKATRQFADLKHPSERITWVSEIVDAGGDYPKFRIYPQDRPKEYIEGETPSSPWVTALKTLSSIRGEKGKANTISGPEAYLLSHPTTIYLIQHMEGARECAKYRMKPIQGEDSENEDENENENE